jgi:hypothetical protein
MIVLYMGTCPRPCYCCCCFYGANFFCASSFFCFPSVNTLHCFTLLAKVTLTFAAFCSSVTPIWSTRTTSNCRHPYYYYFSYEAKLCLRKLILLLFFSELTPLHWAAINCHLETVRLLVESKADIAARRTECFSPPPSRHLSLTICPAVMAIYYHGIFV